MKKHGCLWWLCIGWWWLPTKWVFYSIPAYLTRKIKEIAQTQAAPQPPKPATTPQTAQPAPDNVKTYRAVGMSYRLDALLSLGVRNEDYNKPVKDLVAEGLTEQSIYEYNFFPWLAELVPEPDNPHDQKAIKVVINGIHVAYIKAGSCAHLLKVIRENRVKKIDCKIRGGKYKYVSCEYDDERDKETYTMERGEKPYTVTLYVTEE